MTPTLPFIPENAPFTPEQRAWLNGFLAGLFSSAPAAQASPAAQGLKLAVLYATQGGTAERLAKKLTKELKGKGHEVTLGSLESGTPTALAAHENALILASTYGEGEPPDAVKPFADALFSPDAPRLDNLRFSVFALGDRHYEHFCKFGADLDERLRTLGAASIVPRVESDVDVDEPFERWKTDLLSRLAQSAHHSDTKPPSAPAKPATEEHLRISDNIAPASIYSRERPYLAELRERTPLTSRESSKVTMHLALALDDPAFTYEAGDACGIIPTNDPALVAAILSLLPFAASTTVDLPRIGPVTIEQALLHHLQPTRLTRKIVQAFAAHARSRTLESLLLPEQAVHLEAFMYDRGPIDLLHQYPGVITQAGDLAAMLPRLAPRLYSISSSPAAHVGEVHTTVAVVRYRSHDRERGGVCSTMLADRANIGAKLPVYIQPNKKFRLPADSSTPIIMIGPGTGIAPFRAFLHERRALGANGKNWLFFGERSASTDFLYCRELREMLDDRHLTRLDTAFSRDQEHKIYVQDRMIEYGAELWSWLNEGGQVFVCGDASRMAKDVDAALHAVVAKHGTMSNDNAKDFIMQLHEDHRYHRDVY
jgi:sulfite reductase (NADPH) flavoprotein alpha-component